MEREVELQRAKVVNGFSSHWKMLDDAGVPERQIAQQVGTAWAKEVQMLCLLERALEAIS